MLSELKQEQAEALLPFARPVEFHLCCSAVLQGASPGRVFADDPCRPDAGFVLSAEGCYLIGDPTNAAFAAGFRELLFSPDGLGIPLPALRFLVSSPPWVDCLAEAVRPRPLQALPRYHYICTRDALNRSVAVPAGASVRRLNAGVLAAEGTAVPEHLRRWARSNWGCESRFLSTGFGVVTIVEDEIVSWSLADCVADGQCEIGIHTAEASRRRGYATLTAMSAAAHALDNGFSAAGWHCDHDNVGSWRTAEKAGFRRERSYEMFRIAG